MDKLTVGAWMCEAPKTGIKRIQCYNKEKEYMTTLTSRGVSIIDVDRKMVCKTKRDKYANYASCTK